MGLPFPRHLIDHLQKIVSIDNLLQVLPDPGERGQDIAPLGPHEPHALAIKKDQP